MATNPLRSLKNPLIMAMLVVSLIFSLIFYAVNLNRLGGSPRNGSNGKRMRLPGLSAKEHSQPPTTGQGNSSTTWEQAELNLAGLCPRWGPVHWSKCRAVLERRLGVENITCPNACVTFKGFGGLNNNIRQLANIWAIFVNPRRVPSEDRASILLDSFWFERSGDMVDYDQLERLCIFPSWQLGGRLTTCEEIPAKAAYTNAFIRKSLPRLSAEVGGDDLGSFVSWIFMGAVSEKARREVDVQLAPLGRDFSALHTRFLEGTCNQKFSVNGSGRSNAMCEFKTAFIEAEMRKIGHTGQVFVVFSDRQRMDLVEKVLRRMNGTLSANFSPWLDQLVMIHSARFLGNYQSTVSKNVKMVRDTLFKNVMTALPSKSFERENYIPLPRNNSPDG